MVKSEHEYFGRLCEDLDHVIEVINRVGKELAEDPHWDPLVLKAPQVLRVDAFGDSGIEIKILGELRLRIKKAFDKEGIEIPWLIPKSNLVTYLLVSLMSRRQKTKKYSFPIFYSSSQVLRLFINDSFSM